MVNYTVDRYDWRNLRMFCNSHACTIHLFFQLGYGYGIQQQRCLILRKAQVIPL